MHDQLEILGRVVIEPLLDAEARSHRWREHAEPRRRADERESLDRHRDRLCLRTFGQSDVDLVVLHRGIEELLDHRSQPVDLVDEENVAGPQVRERADEVAGLLQGGPGGGADVHTELARDELRERSLAEARGPEEQRVIERLAPAERGVDVDPEAVFHLLLPDELSQSLWPERELYGPFFGELFGSGDFAWGHRLGVAIVCDQSNRRNSDCQSFSRPAPLQSTAAEQPLDAARTGRGTSRGRRGS